MSNQTLTLAPAAGAGIGKMVAEALLADAQFIPLMKEAAAGALSATTRRWDKDSEDWIIEPDYRTRLQAWLGILAHMEGDPVKRVIHAHVGDGKATDPLAALHESPALLEAVERMAAKARHRDLKPARHARKVEVEAEAIEEAPPVA